ncbi:BREX-1 system adenine-specific DNA-methyltransferase PglX [Cellulosimicrobium composti]|uniref:site-specific DNA-methyltransferase (adenine-specific) n=1 Tax=Cellulosimicrobium composti TaxID=2672572 RepID=A0ABX0BF12_9MICO|nr:BREX-1 system adenine-specific DNA-methyltransferase PglX [Cellulosimicrobium composti]NDO90275.1 BREX-1 system adenine-specific DNA-methyltransferase PglX [Cellulosimicrobium composti]
MDTAPLKFFATSARTELIREVGARITAVLAQGSPERVEQPRAVTALERAIAAGGGGDQGRAHVADKVAYTWFNRIIALRFMDANGYTGIGVVSPATDQVGQPEVLAAAKRGQVDGDVVKGANATIIPGLLNGTRQPRPGIDAQAEAYALLLADYCRYWNRAMPFMFEREGDYTELLIPANLLAEDSALSRSVKVLTGDVCQDVEVIGWLYQFYISERKDEVFAGFKKNKKAGADEIPAATQLFTPHWIVRYLVENSLGRLWMLNHPHSRLVDQMDYYIAPVDEEADFLKITTPEELKVVDPACGSGHMLTYAFDLLYAIYEEEGYTPSQIPGLILTNNLYGTEIDQRAGALAAFALTMKAAAKRKLFLKNPVEPNVCVIEPISFSPEELDFLVTTSGDKYAEEAFWNQFAEADILGALIEPDPSLVAPLRRHIESLDNHGDLLLGDTLNWAARVVEQAEYLSQRYHIVVANPPYMGSSNMAGALEAFIQRHMADAKADLFATFIRRALTLVVRGGTVSMITKQNWLFRPAFSSLRNELLAAHQLGQVLHFGPGAFDSLSGEVASTAAFVLNLHESGRECWFARLVDGENEAAKESALREAIASSRRVFRRNLNDFLAIPGAPVCYWMSDAKLAVLGSGPYLGDVLNPREGMATGNNARYLRFWWEVSASETNRSAESRQAAKSSGKRWFPYNKGGGPRRWYGHDEFVVDWYNDGAELQTTLHPSGTRIWAHNFNLEFIFKEAVSWSSITSRGLALRYYPPGFLFDATGLCAYPRAERASMFAALALVNTKYGSEFADLLNPTHHFKAGDFARLPLPKVDAEQIERYASDAIEIAREDWLTQETAPGFTGLPVAPDVGTMSSWVERCRSLGEERTTTLLQIEQRIQREIGAALEEDDNGSSAIERSRITLFGNARYAHGTSDDPEREARRDLVVDLVSFAIGCMFGRYSLDEPGMILADQGATLQDYLAKVPSPRFLPDADNVIPIVAGDWFEDDIVERFRQFLRAAFGEQHFEENLRFVTESLGVKNLRDYLVKSFYKDHIQRYNKRPIYWLFSSPKGSFNALIYMHRYTPSTVSTVLTYLREYATKLESALQQAERVGDAKEADRLRKILVELNEYERDTLYPKASENVVIDLNDGVKANYPKFGVALKKVPGLEAVGD